MKLDITDLGPGRWLKVEHVVGAANGKPIRVSLMEGISGVLKIGSTLSTCLATTRTIATEEAVNAAAHELIRIVGDYKNVVGNYPPGAKE